MNIIGKTDNMTAYLDNNGSVLTVEGSGFLDYHKLIPKNENLCGTVETVRLGEGITEVSHGAFNHYNKLKAVDVPQSLTEIKYAFKFLPRNYVNEIQMRGGVLLDYAFVTEMSSRPYEKLFMRLPNARFTVSEGSDSILLKTYTPEELARFRETASHWRYGTTGGWSHETWYKDEHHDIAYCKEIPEEDYLILNGEMVGVRRYTGWTENGYGGYQDHTKLTDMYFDRRNGVMELKLSESTGSDEFSSGSHNAKHLVKVD